MSLPKIGVRVANCFNDDAKRTYPMIGKCNNEKMVGELGITPCSAKECY